MLINGFEKAQYIKPHMVGKGLQPFDAHCCHMGTAIKHPVPDRVKPSFVIFDIRVLGRSDLSVRVPKITNDGLTCGNSGRQRVMRRRYPIPLGCLSVCLVLVTDKTCFSE